LYGTTSSGGGLRLRQHFQSRSNVWRRAGTAPIRQRTDGAYPTVGLTADQSGNFYGNDRRRGNLDRVSFFNLRCSELRTSQ
jgi:hypothetical protein